MFVFPLRSLFLVDSLAKPFERNDPNRVPLTEDAIRKYVGTYIAASRSTCIVASRKSSGR
jgi:hypothetical protein